MHRNDLIYKLNAYTPFDDTEAKYKERMLHFITEYPTCFDRELEIGHMTASAWLLDKTGQKALLMHHKKLDIWCQLGGHCDSDSDILRVAIKEAQEESGIIGIEPISEKIFDIDIHLIPENKKEQAHYHYDVRFLLQVMSNEEVVQNRESKELRWINKNKLELPTQEKSVTRMFTKWLSLSS